MQIFVNTNYDFVRWRFHAVAFSVLFVLVGFGSVHEERDQLGHRLRRRREHHPEVQDAVPMDRLRADLKDASIQQYGKPEDNAVLIRLPQLKQRERLRRPDRGEADQRPQSGSRERQARPQLPGPRPPHRPAHAGRSRQQGHQRPRQHTTTTSRRTIINKRSELGIFTTMSQVTSRPGRHAGRSPACSTRRRSSARSTC